MYRKNTFNIGNIDIMVGGVGSDGTFPDVGEVIKKSRSQYKVVASQPMDSPVFSGGPPGYGRVTFPPRCFSLTEERQK